MAEKAVHSTTLNPIDIVFRSLSVDVHDKATGLQKTILQGVSGSARSGRLLAIMGPSGAGKSTLLDVISNTSNSDGVNVQGSLMVNGKPLRKRAFRRISCYVQQRDVLLCSATVREAITTSALLKLPHSMSRAEKDEKVNQVIKELELETCADTVIGDETLGMKGISGGQKRRVSVGIELIKDPSVIFLDEPTSGLDSEMALSCMEVLVRLARAGRTVVCTIHQPNSDITSLFDDFMLLSAGHSVYTGPWHGAVPHFSLLGYNCPSFKNPTDYFMSVLRDPKASEALRTANDKAVAAMDLEVDEYPSGGRQGNSDDGGDLEQAETPSKAAEQSATIVYEQHKTPAWYQVVVLANRRLKDWIRNPNMLAAELVQYIFIALFIGLMYQGTFKDNTNEGVFNRTAAIWFAFAVMSFTPSYTSVTNWDKERQLLKREVGQKMYSIQTNYVARALCMLPFQAIQCLLFVGIMYFFAGFQKDAAKFFTFFFTLLLFQLVSEGIGMLCALPVKTATSGIILLTFVMLLMLSFSGFLVSNIPVYFKWLNKASYFTYAFSALVQNEFNGLTLTTDDGVQVSGISQVPGSVLTEFSVWGNVGILAAQFAGVEMLKLVGMHLANRFNWL